MIQTYFVTLSLTFIKEAVRVKITQIRRIKKWKIRIGRYCCFAVSSVLRRSGSFYGAGNRKGVDAIARQPEASGKITTTLMIGLGLTESAAIYGFVSALIMIFTKM